MHRKKGLADGMGKCWRNAIYLLSLLAVKGQKDTHKWTESEKKPEVVSRQEMISLHTRSQRLKHIHPFLTFMTIE